MRTTASAIARICGGRLTGNDSVIETFAFDSRRIACDSHTVFVALCGATRDGHHYIEGLRGRGICNFIVSSNYPLPELKEGEAFIAVDDTLAALQAVASHMRSDISGTVAAVTGSNGKTVVKEWIAALWRGKGGLFVSPKSYNSQIGVAVAITMCEGDEVLSVFEAGVSKPGEMERLERMIRPHICVITNIGEAHDVNFTSRGDKLRQKLHIASHSRAIVYCSDHAEVAHAVTQEYADRDLFDWGTSPTARMRVTGCVQSNGTTLITFTVSGADYSTIVPFTDASSLDNVLTALAFYACLDAIEGGQRLKGALSATGELRPVAMRLEMRQGINGSVVLNDSYNSDTGSLAVALDRLCDISADRPKIAIISDISQSGYLPERLYAKVADMLRHHGVGRLHAIGSDITASKELFVGIDSSFYPSTEQFIEQFDRSSTAGAAVLLKGARQFAFERISRMLEVQRHSTVMEVDLAAMCFNLNYHRRLLRPGVKTVAMVKASSYGHGGVEVAAALERQHVDYFAVAYTDEGVTLRQGGITTPIIVLNSEPSGFAAMIDYSLEPEIYDFESLELFRSDVRRAAESHYPVHIKLDTGMHRLGFAEDELQPLAERLAGDRTLSIKSIFSHFPSSDNPDQDDLTIRQIELFDRMSSRLMQLLGDKSILRHLSNTWGIERFAQAQFDMVRLGLGLYGISPFTDDLQSVTSLKSVISQIRSLPAGERIGYNRRGVTGVDSVIATVPIGYADGLRRALSCGRWSFTVNGHKAPIIGNICMDACMIDITGIPAAVGDEVTIFSGNREIVQMAEILDTIPYEILTLIAPRVKRVYFD